jgi:uncharacterized protein YndB with AHSA1/START domain
MTQTTQEMVITRVFDAPRELVYRAFTDPDQLAEWFAPVGYSVPRETVELDVRPGGYERMVMLKDDDPSFREPMDSVYTEVIENELLVGYQKIENMPGAEGLTRWDVRIEFHEETGGKTRLEMRLAAFGGQMERELRQGWESSFTKLDKLLHAG